ncbi:MipA/OmpV family protein [Arenibacterium sp. LLYu02]|uniref:MipA/OmpV family protein n=1 Tax=Arenibacterium sp. LLYu02 TaxID=3404132 RepID=UPI003B21173C
MIGQKSPYSVRSIFLRPVVLTALIGIVGSEAAAQDFGPEDGSSKKWEFVLGGGAFYGPTFEGSNESEATGLPFFSVTYDDRFTLGIDGLSAKVYDNSGFSLTTKLGYEFGWTEDDDPDLAGLGDVEGGATLGFGIEYNADPFIVYADIDRSLGDSEGLVGKFGVEVSRPVGRVLLGAGLSATYADANHMQSYFGVTTAQSAASGYATYTPEAGFKRADLELSATYMFSENWMLRGQVEFGQLLGDAADSPIVQEKTQTTAGLFVAYRF